MAVNVVVDEATGRVVESEERWRPTSELPYILTLEDTRNLRKSWRSKAEGARLEAWKQLQPLFTPEVWQQVLSHLEDWG